MPSDDSGWVNLGPCQCCQPLGYYYSYYSGYYGAGDNTSGTIFADCCESPINKTLFATVVGCNGGTFPMQYDEGASDPPGITVWDSGPGTICDVPEASSLITIRCESSFPNPGGTWSAFMYDGVCTGTIISVSCDPFMMEVEFDVSLAGCTCGPVTVFITE
jgi:hypothetical protein